MTGLASTSPRLPPAANSTERSTAIERIIGGAQSAGGASGPAPPDPAGARLRALKGKGPPAAGRALLPLRGSAYSSLRLGLTSRTTGREPAPILLMLFIGSPSQRVSEAELRKAFTSPQSLQRPMLVAPWGLSISQWCLQVGASSRWTTCSSITVDISLLLDPGS